MIVTCVTNRADALSDNQRGRVTQPTAVYQVTAGQRYAVGGMLLWETTLLFLVRSDGGRPYAAPAGLFETAPMNMPEDWWFTTAAGVAMSGVRLWENPLVAIWGYEELVDDETHLDRLLEGDPSAADVFFRHLEAGA